MFESFLKHATVERNKTIESKEPHEKEVGVIDTFQDKERVFQDTVKEKILSAEPEVLQGKKMRTALALSVLIGASSSVLANESEDTLGFDGDFSVSSPTYSTVDKVSLGERFFKKDTDTESDIDFNSSKEELFSQLDYRSRYAASLKITKAIRFSKNVTEYFEKLTDIQNDSFSDIEKLYMLRNIGGALGRTYNYDMLDNSEYITVSDEDMFTGLQSIYLDGKIKKTGMCGNIHTFLVKAAKEMGFESWLQSGLAEGGGHVWAGMIAGEGDDKQIVFMDYSAVIPTGTLDYKDSLGVVERYHKNVSVLNTIVGDENKTLFPVKSKGGEVLQYASRTEDTSADIVEEQLNTTEERGGIEVRISDTEREFTIENDTVGFHVFEFSDKGDPYQSVEKTQAFGGTIGGTYAGFRLDADATVLNVEHKDLRDGVIDTELLVTQIAASYIQERNFTAEEFGSFTVDFGTTLRTAIARNMDDIHNRAKARSVSDYAVSGAITYLDPSERYSFYIGDTTLKSEMSSDFQDQELQLRNLKNTLTVGGSVEVFDATVVGAEMSHTAVPYGEESEIKLAAEKEHFSADVSFSKTDSEYERFVPSTKKVAVEATYMQPRWSVVFGYAYTEEKYAGQEDGGGSNKVSFQINIW